MRKKEPPNETRHRERGEQGFDKVKSLWGGGGLEGGGRTLVPFMGILQKGPPAPSKLYPYSFTPPPRAL